MARPRTRREREARELEKLDKREALVRMSTLLEEVQGRPREQLQVLTRSEKVQQSLRRLSRRVSVKLKAKGPRRMLMLCRSRSRSERMRILLVRIGIPLGPKAPLDIGIPLGPKASRREKSTPLGRPNSIFRLPTPASGRPKRCSPDKV